MSLVSHIRSIPVAWAGTLVLAAAGLASCESPLSYADRRMLEVAEERWTRRGFTDYSFEMQRSCFCPPELTGWSRVEVAGSSVQRVVLLSSGEVITDSRRGFWPTMEELFKSIHEAAGAEWVERVELEFDATLGFPTMIQWLSPPDVLDGGGVDRLRNAVPLSNARF